MDLKVGKILHTRIDRIYLVRPVRLIFIFDLDISQAHELSDGVKIDIHYSDLFKYIQCG